MSYKVKGAISLLDLERARRPAELLRERITQLHQEMFPLPFTTRAYALPDMLVIELESANGKHPMTMSQLFEAFYFAGSKNPEPTEIRMSTAWYKFFREQATALARARGDYREQPDLFQGARVVHDAAVSAATGFLFRRGK